jgi:hypothetical protein
MNASDAKINAVTQILATETAGINNVLTIFSFHNELYFS